MVLLGPLFVQSPRFKFTSFGFGPRLFSLLNLQNRRRNAITWSGIRTQTTSSAAEVSEWEHDELHDEVKATEKETALRLALSRLSSDFGRESMLSLQRFFGSRNAPVISTGSLKLDLALGIGGLPKGRIVEIYGREASGKTTLALHIIKEAQKLGGYCAYIDVESGMDPLLAEAMGVDTKNLLLSQPESAENLLSMVDTLTRSGSIDVIVVDSVAALVPQRELDLPIGGTYDDIQSQIMTKALRKIHGSLCNSGTLLIFVNQVRMNIKSAQGFGPADEITCGGNALKFYAAMRLRLVRKGLLKTDGKATGLGICVQVVKNKLAPAMKKAELEIKFGRGICCQSEVLELGCEHGVILKEGSSYFIDGEVLDSEQDALHYLDQTHGLQDEIVKILRSQLFKRVA